LKKRQYRRRKSFSSRDKKTHGRTLSTRPKEIAKFVKKKARLGQHTIKSGVLIGFGQVRHHKTSGLKSFSEGDYILYSEFGTTWKQKLPLLDIHMFTDCTADEIKVSLKTLVEKLKASTLELDMLLVYFGGHGNEESLFGTDGRSIERRWVLSLFNSVILKSTEGSLKLFIFDCCRDHVGRKVVNAKLPPNALVHDATSQGAPAYGDSDLCFTRLWIEALKDKKHFEIRDKVVAVEQMVLESCLDQCPAVQLTEEGFKGFWIV
jgi:hypothetical protein